MADKKDDPVKPAAPDHGGPSVAGPGAAKPSDAAKRPQATIDGKAVELAATPIPPRPSAPPSAASQPATPASAGSSSAGARPGAGKPDAGKSLPGSRPTTAGPAAPAPRSSSRVGSLLTNLIAGVVGGATAWYGATTLGPELGLLPPSPVAGATRLLESKVASLESRLIALAPTADVGAKLARAESEIARLQAAVAGAGDVKALETRLAARIDTVSREAAAAAQAAEGEAGQRIRRMEERLRLMGEAAGNGQAPGAVPQLAALTGRLVDLETTVTTQLVALRKAVAQDVESRLVATTETSEAARSGATRVDREMATVKAETATTSSRLDTVKSELDRLAGALQAVRTEAAAARSAAETVRADTDARLSATAKPADVASAIAPLAGRIATLDQGLQAVTRAEDDRRATAQRVVLALELVNLKRVVDRGQRYATELAAVRPLAAGTVDLAALERHKDTGLPTLTDLTREFRTAAAAMIEAERTPASGGVFDRLLAGAGSIVRVRKVGQGADDRSVEAIVARLEAALEDGRVADAASESRALPSKSAAAAQVFLVRLESRAAVDTAIASLEAALKSSLAAAKPTN